MLVFPVLTEIAAERVGDPSRDERWAVTYDLGAPTLLGEKTEELWALPRVQLNRMWDTLISNPRSREDIEAFTSFVNGKLRICSPLFEETDQRFLDWNGNPIGLIQEKLDPEAAADVVYSYMHLRKEWLTAAVDSPLDFDFLSEGEAETSDLYKEICNFVRKVLPGMVYVDYSEIDEWEQDLTDREEGSQKRAMEGRSTLRQICGRRKRLSFDEFVKHLERIFAEWTSIFIDKPDYLELRVVGDLDSLLGTGEVRVAELTSHCVRLRLYDLGSKVRVVPVVPEPVEDWTMTMSVANAQKIGAALMGNPHWNRNWLGRKTLVLGGHEFRVRKGQER
ncbi:hypothetical protein VR010_11145 [Actinomycetaceae bacterium L2_0104]